MANPKYKKSRSRTRTRRSSINISSPNFIECPNCKESVLPHRVCTSCGFYKGRDIYNLKEKVKK